MIEKSSYTHGPWNSEKRGSMCLCVYVCACVHVCVCDNLLQFLSNCRVSPMAIGVRWRWRVKSLHHKVPIPLLHIIWNRRLGMENEIIYTQWRHVFLRWMEHAIFRNMSSSAEMKWLRSRMRGKLIILEWEWKNGAVRVYFTHPIIYNIILLLRTLRIKNTSLYSFNPLLILLCIILTSE